MVDIGPTMWDKPGCEVLGWLFIEFPGFTSVWREYFVDDTALAVLHAGLARLPDSGDVMPGCGGLRKVRWPDPRRGKGKRGGLRVVYLLVPEVRVVVLVDVYSKNEAEDLTQDEKRHVTRLAAAVRAELIANFRKDTRK